jgi:hypothetical protein
MNNIKDMVKDGKKVTFMFYKSKELWYKTECGFEYPIPVEDTGDGIFLNEDKAMYHMRYIRKHLDMIVKEKEASNSLA